MTAESALLTRMSSPISHDSGDMQYSRDLLLDWMDDGNNSPFMNAMTNGNLFASDLQLPASTDGSTYAEPLSPLAAPSEWSLPNGSVVHADPATGALHLNGQLCPTMKFDPSQPGAMQIEALTLNHVAAEQQAAQDSMNGVTTASHSSTNGSKQRKTNRLSTGSSSSSSHEEQSRVKRSKVSPSTLAKLSSGLSAGALWQDVVSSALLTCIIKRISDMESQALQARNAPIAFIEQMLAFISAALTPADAAQYISAFLSRPRIRQLVGEEEAQKLRTREYNINFTRAPDEPLPDCDDDMPRLPMMKVHHVSTEADPNRAVLNISRSVVVNRELERVLGWSQADIKGLFTKWGNLALWAITAPQDDLAEAHRNYQKHKTADTELALLTAMKRLSREIRRVFLLYHTGFVEGRLQFTLQLDIAARYGGVMKCQVIVRQFQHFSEDSGKSLSYCFVPLT